ncbi:MAG: HAMP domain-containing protein [Candidatus Omnitrophica bacterium]|nr:HAMP domain-containing protein [Candidatus Omnitrophota bacterium]
MKIGLRVILGILAIVLTILISSFLSVNISEKALQDFIGHEAISKTQEALETIDDTILIRIEEVDFFAHAISSHPILAESNRYFDTHPNLAKYIQEKDKEWISLPKEAITPFIKEIVGNPLSQQIRWRLQETHPQEKIFAEVFITNKYGVNVAQSTKTTDYYQGDELWWQQAKETGRHIADLQFDESSEQYAITIASRIDDQNGNFAGVIKALLTVDEITNLIQKNILRAREQVLMTLITKEGKIIYSSEGYKPFRDVSDLLTLKRQSGAGKKFLIVEDEEGQKSKGFLAWAESEGSHEFPGFQWILFSQYETNTLFAPIKRLKITLLTITLLVTFISIIIGFSISYSVSSPINKLTGIAQNLSEGRLTVAIPDDLKNLTDEIGQFAKVFDSMRQRLKITYDSLEKKVKERTADLENKTFQLEKTKKELERSNKDLEQFAYVASHDLQEPLRKIIAFGDLFQEEMGRNISENAKDYLHRMQNAAYRMRNLIEGLLQYSRLNTRALPFEEVDLEKIVQDVLGTLELTIQETGATIEVGYLPRMKADQLQMEQLFQNLIMNALKFRKPGQKPRITITSWPAQIGWVQIAIQDNGIGFDEKYTERIFYPFQRLHKSGEFEGAGIGLSICKKIVERHGGQISVKSNPQEGSTFIIHLPTHEIERSQK